MSPKPATPPKPYTIHVPDARLTHLHDRLALTTLPDELDAAQWDYGAPLSDIKRLLKQWQSTFDWRAQEAKLNQLPHFTTTVPVDHFDDVDLHFVHQTSPRAGAIPLLFVHGWPGSFVEVSRILPLLTQPPADDDDDDSPAFHVVAPSLPNFGFSAAVHKRGFNLAQYAEVCHNLMRALGYDEYVTQGGDWGFYITRAMGLRYPGSCKASHVNMVRAHAPGFLSQPVRAAAHAVTPYSAVEKRGMERTAWFQQHGNAYRLLQATKPQTLAYALADSPVGLLAWLWEKLHDWTDAYPWSDEEILTWVSIYWFSTAGPAASVRIYYEATHEPVDGSIPFVHRDRTQEWIGGVKLGVAHFPMELGVVPRSWAHTLGPLVYEGESENGGHFAAWECPEKLVGMMRAMFERGGPCAGIVKGKSGYA